MRTRSSLFTARERRIGLLALLAAAALTLTLIVAEGAFSPPLGIYGSGAQAVQMPGVVDAQPLGRAATF
ncbi:hypothetical protein BZG35_11345 [Brevundimonas sp. LM2]|uniref:hypothetical protein n=1 Tax=Brevundimonas sp. LM2 TaxID=1938605 RepID=UPI00098405BC|nr:hypothetical protein [Brevundimonas sp. LM2]AQR62171.1 hypothetical protein BZG35_11345 [Brevundimonas sp. LM2]